jgi:hypothetical protein
MKIELTIKTTYLPEWQCYEGVRELLQNAKDAETEFSAPMTVRHRADTLIIENEGCSLPHEALLLGHTSKSERTDLIGNFGEGLKLGLLALVRAGHKVKVRSGSEVWVPSIQRSEKFNADVLCFEIIKGRKDDNRVQLEVGGIAAADWAIMKQCFLFLLDSKELEKVRVSSYTGALLLGDAYKGKVFVKGIFVQNDPKLQFGYDFTDTALDRDRKMVDKYALSYKCQAIWREALAKRPDLVTDFTRMLDQESADVDGMDTWSANYLPEAVRQEVVKTFKGRHGELAVPVSSLADSKDIEHFGKHGIVAPKALRAVLESIMGTAADVREELRSEAVKTYSWHELTITEKMHLDWAIGLVNAVTPLRLDSIDVVDIRDPLLLGMFKDNRVVIAHTVLANRMETLWILVHEHAHKVGADGDKSHVDAIEEIWRGIVANLVAVK